LLAINAVPAVGLGYLSGPNREQGSLLQKQVGRMAASYNTGARNPKKELRNMTVTCRRVRTTSGNLPTE